MWTTGRVCCLSLSLILFYQDRCVYTRALLLPLQLLLDRMILRLGVA